MFRHSLFRPACCFTTAPASGAARASKSEFVTAHGTERPTLGQPRKYQSARRAAVQEPGLPTRWSFGWPYGGQQNACISTSYFICYPLRAAGKQWLKTISLRTKAHQIMAANTYHCRPESRFTNCRMQSRSLNHVVKLFITPTFHT